MDSALDVSKVISAKDLQLASVPVYKEEDIVGLQVRGTSVYEGEKSSLLNTIQELMKEV